MPPLGLHMVVARSLAGDLDSRVVDADRGAYYLGATTPDIRVLTRWDRARTHFFDLQCLSEQSGVHRLFEQEPGAARCRRPRRVDRGVRRRLHLASRAR